MASSTKTLSVYISLKSKAFATGLKKLQTGLKNFGTKLKATGARLTTSLTMPIALAGGASVKLASDFESSMTKIQTLVGTSAKDVELLKDQVLDLAGKTATAPKELADGLFFIQSAGFKGKEGIEALEVSAKGAAMGMGEMTDIANALTSIMTGYADSGMTAAKAGDLLHEILKQGKFEASEFMDKIGAVIPTAAGFGISMEQMGAAVATMSKVSGDASGSLTAINRLMLSLNAPAEQQSKTLNKVFGSYENLSKSLKGDFMGTLNQVFTALEGNDQELIKVFGSAKAVQGAFATAGLQTETYAEVLDGMNNSLGNVEEGFKVTSETSSFKFEQALADLKTAGIKLGEALLPVVSKLMNKLSDFAKKFGNMSDETRKKVLLVAGALALLGPALSLIGSMSTVISGLIGPFIALGSAIWGASAPVLAIIAGIVLYGVLVGTVIHQVVKNWDEVKVKLVEVINYFIDLYNESNFFRYMVEVIGLTFKTVWEYIKTGIGQIGTLFTGLGKIISNLFNKEERQKAIDEMFAGWKDGVEDFVSTTGENVDKAIENIKGNREKIEFITEEDIQEFVDKGKEMGEQLWDSIKDGAGKAKESIMGFIFGGGKKEDTETEEEEDDGFFAMTEDEIAELQKALNEDVVKEKPEWMKNLALQWGETIAEMQTKLTELKDGFAEGFADMVATTITEGGNLAENFKNFMVDMVKQIGQLIIKMLVFKALMAAMGMGGIPTGGAGKGFLGSLFGFAEGGMVTGPTPVMVGEGRGTNISNPEVIAPLDKLQSMIGGAGGGLLHGSISGENILLSNQRSLISQNRVGGSVTDF